MSLTVLAIAQAVCYEGNQPAPATLYSNTDPAALQLLHLFYAVGRELRSERIWPQLKKSATITTSNGVTSYALATDFYSFLTETEWDQTLARPMVGPQSDENFNLILYGVGGATTTTTYRIFGPINGNMINIRPTPTTTNHTLSYDYLSSGWILHTATWQETISADTDTVAFDDELMLLGLKSKYYAMKGLDYEAIEADYKSKIDQARGRFYGAYKGSFNRYPKSMRRYMPSTAGGWSF